MNSAEVPELFANDPVSASLTEIIRAVGEGGRLPPERELAANLHVSRVAVRDRLSVLQGLGVLRRRTGSGTFVEGLRPEVWSLALGMALDSSLLSLKALESVRIGLERQAAKEASQLADPVLIAYMRRAIDDMSASTDAHSIVEADLMFHQSLLRASGNAALAFFADALVGVLSRDLDERVRRYQAALDEVASRSLIERLHTGIYEAVLVGNASAAMRAVDDHFDTFEALVASTSAV